MADFVYAGNYMQPGLPGKWVDLGDGSFAPVFADDIASGVQITNSSGNVANASAVATLAAAAGKTTYLTSYTITGGGATAASIVNATIANVVGGTMTLNVIVPAGATLGITPLIVVFLEPVPATAVNTAIVLTLPALGAGNTNAAVTATGFQL